MSSPAELPAFLAWLREVTEAAWRDVPSRTFADYQRAQIGGAAWQPGTRWTGGLSDGEVAEIEARHGVRFSPDHRTFLQTLHATTPKQRGARFVDGGGMIDVERPGFYDWRTDDAAIRDARAEIVEGLVFDVENSRLWGEDWGARPAAAPERAARVAELVAAAPPLLPIFGHRFVLADGPVLSVHQSDIIVYGRDLRSYLLSELYDLIDIERDFATWSAIETHSIPFWGELIG